MKKLKDFSQFVDHTGMLENFKQIKTEVSPALLKKLKNLVATECPYGWSACGETLELLKKACSENSKLYIATQVENDNGNGITYENETRIVNRNIYYLCTKNSDKLVYFTEKF